MNVLFEKAISLLISTFLLGLSAGPFTHFIITLQFVAFGKVTNELIQTISQLILFGATFHDCHLNTFRNSGECLNELLEIHLHMSSLY